jgi:hypothetical protein
MYNINILVLNDDNRPELIPCQMISITVQNKNVSFLHYILYLGAPIWIPSLTSTNEGDISILDSYFFFIQKMYIEIEYVWLLVTDNVG